MSDADSEPVDAKPSSYAESPIEYWQLLEAERQRDENAYIEYTGTAEYTKHLLETFNALQRVEEFAPGDLVQWKPRLKNQRYPHYGRPAVVIGPIEPPLESENQTDGDTSKVDVLLGFLDGESDLRVYGYQSSRFTRWASQ